MDEVRAKYDDGCLRYGASSRGTYAHPGDDIWTWRVEHERELRDADWEILEASRRRIRQQRLLLRVAMWVQCLGTAAYFWLLGGVSR